MSAVVVCRRGVSTVSSSIRAVSTVHQKKDLQSINTSCNVITNSIPQYRNYNTSTTNLEKINDIHVTIENSSNSTSKTNTKSSSGSSCSTPHLNNNNNVEADDEEEEEQEDMFVTSDPILGVGTILEHGGPRRGGSLKEPTRFGDWERKGRCTDF